jgi:hypothetical protein
LAANVLLRALGNDLVAIVYLKINENNGAWLEEPVLDTVTSLTPIYKLTEI